MSSEASQVWLLGEDMTTNELIELLESRFGNPYAPKHYHCIQLAIAELRRLQTELENK